MYSADRGSPWWTAAVVVTHTLWSQLLRHYRAGGAWGTLEIGAGARAQQCLETPHGFDGLDLWQFVQHDDASNLVQKRGGPNQESWEALTTVFLLQPGQGNQSVSHSHSWPDIKTDYEPKQTWRPSSATPMKETGHVTSQKTCSHGR